MELLPQNFRVVPLQDATDLLARPAALRARAEAEGYLFFPRLVSPERLDALRLEIRRLCGPFGWFREQPDNPAFVQAMPGARLSGRGFDDPDWVRLQREVNQTEAFAALAREPTVLNVLAAVYGEPALGSDMNLCWVKLPGSPEHTTLPHQDLFYLPGCPELWTAWFPIVDNPFDLGPLAVIPGSHRQGRWHHETPWSGIEVPAEVTWASSEVVPGDVLLFGAGTVHAGWSNVTEGRVRVSADVRFRPVSSPFPL